MLTEIIYDYNIDIFKHMLYLQICRCEQVCKEWKSMIDYRKELKPVVMFGDTPICYFDNTAHFVEYDKKCFSGLIDIPDIPNLPITEIGTVILETSLLTPISFGMYGSLWREIYIDRQQKIQKNCIGHIHNNTYYLKGTLEVSFPNTPFRITINNYRNYYTKKNNINQQLHRSKMFMISHLKTSKGSKVRYEKIKRYITNRYIDYPKYFRDNYKTNGKKAHELILYDLSFY